MPKFNEADSLKNAMYRALEELVGKGGGSFASAPSSRAAAILQRALGWKQEDEQKDKSPTYDEEVLVRLTSERPSVWERLDKLEEWKGLHQNNELNSRIHERVGELELDKTDAGLQRGKLWDRVMGTDKRVGELEEKHAELEQCDKDCTDAHHRKDQRVDALEDVLLKIPREPGDELGGEFLPIRELFNRVRGAEIRVGNVEEAVGFKK